MFNTTISQTFNIKPIKMGNKIVYPCARCKGTGMITDYYDCECVCPVCYGKKVIQVKIDE